MQLTAALTYYHDDDNFSDDDDDDDCYFYCKFDIEGTAKPKAVGKDEDPIDLDLDSV